MKNSLLAASTALLTAATAAQAQDWSGFNAGATLSVASSLFVWEETGTEYTDRFGTSGLGVFAGYNWQNGDRVIGIEASFEDTGGTGVFSGVPGPGDATATLTSKSSLRAKTGKVNNNKLTYFFAGVSSVKSEVEAIGFSVENDTHMGLAIGAGIDIQISQTVFARMEVEHMRTNAITYQFCPFCLADVAYNQTTARVGIGMNF